MVEQFMGVEFLVQVDLSEGDRENIGPSEESFTESKASSAFPYLITAISTLITALSISILALWLLSDENVIFGGPPSTLIAWQEDYERMTGMNDIPSNLDGTGVVICVVDSGIDLGHPGLDNVEIIGWFDAVNGESAPLRRSRAWNCDGGNYFCQRGYWRHLEGIRPARGEGD